MAISLFPNDDASCNMSIIMGHSSSTYLDIATPHALASSPMAANMLVTTDGLGASVSLGISTCT